MHVLQSCFRCTLALMAITCVQARVLSADLYFPPDKGNWEMVPANDGTWDHDKLGELVAYVGDRSSSSLLVLHRGRILIEEYWELPTTAEHLGKDNWYRYVFRGNDKRNRPVEDVSSVQKSIASLLVGIASGKKLLRIDDPVSNHLGKEWCDARSATAITIEHLLTMSSGLTNSLTHDSDPGMKWSYNTSAYWRLLPIIEKATDQRLEDFCKDNLTGKIGMLDSRWFRRGGPGKESNPFGFETTARDLGRLGLLVLAKGRWRNERVVPRKYMQSAFESKIQGTAYGYLWWNNKAHLEAQAQLVSSAPDDMVAAMGIFEKRLYVVPSFELVAVRMGDFVEVENRNQYSNEALFPVREFDTEFWRRLLSAYKSPEP